MTIDANAIFEEELSRRGVSFVKEDADTYRVQVGGLTVTANLANVRRNAERDQDHGAIGRYADKVLDIFRSSRPTWAEASNWLLWAAEPGDSEFADSVRVAVTEEVVRVLTLTDATQSKVTWVTPDMCAEWGVDIETAAATAFANQDRLLEGVSLETAEADGNVLGMVPIDSPYKASSIFARAFRSVVEPVLGWPVLVVIPCRDFIYVVADASPLLARIGSAVVKEFRTSGYPITTEVLRVSNDGIEAIGKFPV